MRNARAFEENVIGSALRDGSIVAQCNVKPCDFEHSPNRLAWDVILRLHSSRDSIDALSVAELLDREEAPPPKPSWMEYLATLSRNTASPQNAPTYATKIREFSALRQAQAIGKALTSADTLDGIDQQIRTLVELTTGTVNHSCHLFDAMQGAIDLMDDGKSHISSGLKDLDSCTGGLHNEDLIVVAARPAMGKTAFMLNLALSSSVAVGMISGEQGREQVGMRCMAINGQVSLHRMRTHSMTDECWSRVAAAMTTAKNKPIWINDKPAPSIDDVIRQARTWKYERNIGVLMIDYLQKLRGGNGADMRLQIGDVVSRLKDLARELKIPVVVLTQVKRDVENKPLGSDAMGRMPFAADMSESGIIEQEADHIYTLYRPEVYTDLPQFRGIAYINICKNRHGPIGHKKIAWRGEFLQFGDLAQSEIQDRWSAAS